MSSEIKIAYIVSAHRYPDQLIRLIDRLNTETDSFFIHVDKKTDDETYRRIVDGLSRFPNIYLLKRHNSPWASFGTVESSIKGINKLIERKIAFDYAALLTGQDYPIKTNDYIKEFLSRNKGKSFIDYSALPARPLRLERGGFDRIERWHFRLFGKRHCFPAMRQFQNPVISILYSALAGLLPERRKFIAGHTPFFGFAYWCLTKERVEYLYDFIRKNRSFVKYFKYVHIPDEMFFQTVLLNSSETDNLVNDDLRHIIWPEEGSHHPAILREQDLDSLKRSPKLFARKFDATVAPVILDLIDKEILMRDAGQGSAYKGSAYN